MIRRCFYCGKEKNVTDTRRKNSKTFHCCHEHRWASIREGLLPYKNREKPLKERFFSKVRKSKDGCWEWIGAKSRGYGQILAFGKVQMAPRVSYVIHLGKIPDGLLVCHKCDNPSCVNPDHLFLGTDSDNTSDCVRKGRHKGPKGSNHPLAKLTDNDALQIKNFYSGGVTVTNLSKRYDVDRKVIYNIINGISYKNGKSCRYSLS